MSGTARFVERASEDRPRAGGVRLAVELAGQAEKARAMHLHPFSAVIDMITRSASSHLRGKGEATAIRRHKGKEAQS